MSLCITSPLGRYCTLDIGVLLLRRSVLPKQSILHFLEFISMKLLFKSLVQNNLIFFQVFFIFAWLLICYFFS
jgi:hypothetical protein